MYLLSEVLCVLLHTCPCKTKSILTGKPLPASHISMKEPPHLLTENLCIYPPASPVSQMCLEGHRQSSREEQTCRKFCCKLCDCPYLWIKLYVHKCCGKWCAVKVSLLKVHRNLCRSTRQHCTLHSSL